MYFKILWSTTTGAEKEFDIIDPAKLNEDCMSYGLDTSEWYGKANCFVESRGINPSFGYFLLRGKDIEVILDTTTISDQGNYKSQVFTLSLYIEFDERLENGTLKNITKPDLFIRKITNVTPSLEGDSSVYLVEVVDLRAFIPGVEHSLNTQLNLDTKLEYLNKVVDYTSEGYIYDSATTDQGEMGETTTTTALTWPEVFEKLFLLRCGGSEESTPSIPVIRPYQFTLNTNDVTPFPSNPPQNIKIGTHDDIAASFYKLLFAVDADLIYEGEGEFSLVKLYDSHVADKEGDTVFDTKMQVDVDLEDWIVGTNTLGSLLMDKDFPLLEDHLYGIPEQLILCCEYAPREDKGYGSTLYYQEALRLLEGPAEAHKPTGPGIKRVELPVVWSDKIQTSDNPLHYYREQWGNNTNNRFWQYPCKRFTFAGFQDFFLSGNVSRISWYSLGAECGTLVENILPIRWDLLAPTELEITGENVIYGRVVNTSSGSTLRIKNIVVVSGPDPRTNIFSNSEEVEINNTPAKSFPANTLVFAIKNRYTYKWELLGSTSSGGSGPTDTIDDRPIRFKLVEDLERGQGYAEANIINLANEPIDENGSSVNDYADTPLWTQFDEVQTGDLRKAPNADVIGGTWEVGDLISSKEERDTGEFFNTDEMQHWEYFEVQIAQIVVVDQEGKRYGYAPYIDPQFGDQDGYIGTAYKLPGDEGENYAGTGFPGYQILDMEGPARWCEGVVAAMDGAQNFFATVAQYYGASPNNRPPKTIASEGGGTGETPSYLVPVNCRLGEGSQLAAGDKVRYLFDDWNGVYVLQDWIPDDDGGGTGGSGNDTLIGLLAEDLTITETLATVTVLHYNGSNPGTTVECSNPDDSIDGVPAVNRMFLGNIGGRVTAEKHAGVWILTSVQVPRVLPV